MKIKTTELFEPEWEYQHQKDRYLINRQKTGKGWYNSKSFEILKEIELNENLAECIGMYLGDGKVTETDKMHLDYTSKDMDLIAKMLTFLEKLGAKNKDFTFTLSYRDGDIRQITQEIEGFIGHHKFRIDKNNRTRCPAVHMQVNGKIFRTVFMKIIFISLPYVRINSSLRKAFLRGYFSAEGSIGHAHKENYISCVSFAYNPKKEIWLRDFCIKCLKLEGVYSHVRIRHEEHNGQIIITNWKNYYKMWKLGVFDGCTRKRRKFLQLFYESKICCKIEEHTRLRLFSGNQYEIAKRIGTYQATVSNMKTCSKRNMWPTVEQIMTLCKLKEINVQEVKRAIQKIRIGNLTILEKDAELINDVFNRENLYSSVCQEDKLLT